MCIVISIESKVEVILIDFFGFVFQVPVTAFVNHPMLHIYQVTVHIYTQRELIYPFNVRVIEKHFLLQHKEIVL